MIPLSGDQTPLVLLLMLIAFLALAARRSGVVRVLTNLVLLGALGGLFFMLFDQRQRFDPYLGRIARIFTLDDQVVAGSEVRIRMAGDGHFWARVSVDGVERRMLVDSGATVTALSVGTAKEAGLNVRDELFPVILNTANGQIEARTSKVADLRLGSIAARNLAVVVSPAFGDADVLGMNFLSRLKSWRVEGSTLILVPHHPQDVAA